MKSWYPNIISLFSGEGVASGNGAGAGVHQCVSTLISNQVCLCIDVCAIRKSLFIDVSFVGCVVCSSYQLQNCCSKETWAVQCLGTECSPRTVMEPVSIPHSQSLVPSLHSSFPVSTPPPPPPSFLPPQLRSLLTRTIHAYVTLYDARNTIHLPQFKLLLCLDEGSMQFFPSAADMEQAVLFPVHTIASTMQKVPVVQVGTNWIC